MNFAHFYNRNEGKEDTQNKRTSARMHADI